jgi:mono/diheme cytochrome c family protein
VYAANCSGCHGAAGAGLPGAFPPLAKSEVVAGDTTKLIHIIAYGLQGSLTVEGKTYNGQMPAWKPQLTDAQIADVINYVRGNWGNTGAKVTAADVAKVSK